MNTPKILFAGLLLGTAAVFCGGCSSIVNAHRQKESMMAGYISGQMEPVRETFAEKLSEPTAFNGSTVGSGDETMWRLEAGSFCFLTGHYDLSLRSFERAEALIGDFDQRAVVNLRRAGAESAMLFTNPNALPYRGLCRDRIMIPVFKAFDYLGKNDDSGFRTELFRLRSTQDKVLADYHSYFQAESQAVEQSRSTNSQAVSGTDANSLLSDPRNQSLAARIAETKQAAHRGFAGFLNPFAIFLSGYGYARDNDFQNASVDFERLFKAMPQNPMVRRYFKTALIQAGKPIPEELKKDAPLEFPIGRNNVLVVFANGRSAAFRQVSIYIPVVFPGYATVAAVAWPVCEYYPASFRTLRVTSDGKASETAVIADMDGILSQEYTDRLPGMIARIVLSTAVKEFGSYAATRAAAQANEFAGAATAIGLAAYKIAMNTADTRTWEILPKEFQVLQIPMPAGRRFTIQPDSAAPSEVVIPAQAESAIVYVNAPGSGYSYTVFSLNSR